MSEAEIPALQAAERLYRLRRTHGEVPAVQEDRPVFREDVPVVLQHGEPLAADLRVGGVEVRHVELPSRKRAVGDVMVEAADAGRGEAVALAHGRPAVAAVEELAGEPQAELRVAGQVGDAPDAQPLRHLPAHAQGVGVLEAERAGERDPSRLQGRAERGLVGGHRAAQDLARICPGVLRVGVHVAPQQCLPEHAGAPEGLVVLDG